MIISGTINDPSDQPIANARLALNKAPVSMPDIALLTNARGEFQLGVPVAGEYEIACYADGFEPQMVIVRVDATNSVSLKLRLRYSSSR